MKSDITFLGKNWICTLLYGIKTLLITVIQLKFVRTIERSFRSTANSTYMFNVSIPLITMFSQMLHLTKTLESKSSHSYTTLTKKSQQHFYSSFVTNSPIHLRSQS